ncbi:MAG: DeoR family transcriptional regulator [Paenibacillaceae bacterium]|jgi:DeoR/GlpR family transcriptional regulator of sugar metabolism|nr:DeoR family transcriptional regulator [Paenibacillaceae bacterium]
MLVAERLQKIVLLVNERGSIRVTELSELCRVTEETIRKDLDKLESEGKLMRSHGGAVSVQDTQQEVPYFERETTNVEEKKQIAMAAVGLIEPRDRIILDASTTAWWIARYLPDAPLTVLTNSMKVALELSGKEKIQVISTGGILMSSSLSFVGPLTERSLETYHVDKMFLSCKGLHLSRGITEPNELQGLVKRKMIRQSDHVYLLADYSKFGVRSFTHVADWTEIHHLVTDARSDPAMIRELKEKGIEVTQLEG